MKVECSSCQAPILRPGRIYCPPKDQWIPERKYKRRRSCSLYMAGQFRELPWTGKPVSVPSPGPTKEQVLASARPAKKPNLFKKILSQGY